MFFLQLLLVDRDLVLLRNLYFFVGRYLDVSGPTGVRIDGPRGGVNWAFFQICKAIKTTLTYAMLVRLNSPTG